MVVLEVHHMIEIGEKAFCMKQEIINDPVLETPIWIKPKILKNSKKACFLVLRFEGGYADNGSVSHEGDK